MNEETSTVAALPMSRWCGLVGGPVLAVVVLTLPLGMTSTAQSAAAIATLMAVWWITEALPLPATSLLPIVLFPLAGVMPVDKATAPYADKIVFLFLGGFFIAQAIERWSLHRRLALLTVLAVGTQLRQLVGGVMLATALVSMWISNTATAAMMLPIGLSLVTLVRERRAEEATPASSHFAVCMMLGIAYAASIGGLGTLVGTPTNSFLAGFAAKHEITVSFRGWLAYGTPLAAVLLAACWGLLTLILFPIGRERLPGGRQVILDELRKMGPMSRGEWVVALVFFSVGLLWIFREPLADWKLALGPLVVGPLPWLKRLDDTLIAVAGALLLFLIPIEPRRGRFVLDWKDTSDTPWGILLLFGGGFSLAAGISSSGLDQWLGEQVKSLAVRPDVSGLGFTVAIVVLLVLATELTSNTPTAAVFLPILHGVAVGLGLKPLALLAPATIAATCGFMLPVGTPPNAIVFASGHLRMRDMLWAGLWMDLLCMVVVPLWSHTLGLRLLMDASQ